MKFIFIVLIVWAISLCSDNAVISGQLGNRILISTKMPIRIVDGKAEFSIIDFYVNYLNGYIIYELPYHKTYQINDHLVYDSVKYEYFICESNGKTGRLFKNIGDSFGVRIAADSIVKSRAYGGVWDMADVFKEVVIKTIDVKKGKGDNFYCRYIFENSCYDSAYFYYDKGLRGIPFSLSKSLDSVYNSKLVQVDFFIEHDIKLTPSSLEGFYVNSISIKRVSSPVPEQIKALLRRFINSDKKLLD